MSLLLSTTSLVGPTAPAWLEETCQRLSDNDPTFKTVDLTHPHLDDVRIKLFARALSENNVVVTLILSCYALVDDGMFAVGSAIAKHQKIEKLQLKDIRNVREITTIFQQLKANTNITELSLRHCHICPRGAVAIADFLKTQPQLQEFRLTDSQLNGTAVETLCDGLKQAGKDLQRVCLVNNDLAVEAANSLCNMLSGSCLRELYVSENELGSDGIRILCHGLLTSNTSLQLLDVRSNGITSTGAMSLQGLLVGSKSLLHLNLSNNDLGNTGAKAIARGLQSRACCLAKLHLSSTGIDEVGALSFAAALRTNQNLQELNLAFNTIGDKGAGEIAMSLVRNTSLRHLSLCRNNIGDDGAKLIATQLPKLRGLKELLLSKNNIGLDGAKALLHGLRENVELEYLNIEDKTLEPVAREIIRWIRLNRAGRRIFRHANNVPITLWSQVFGRISNDTDALFHFLTSKPDVVFDNKHKEAPKVDDNEIEDDPDKSPLRKKKRMTV